MLTGEKLQQIERNVLKVNIERTRLLPTASCLDADITRNVLLRKGPRTSPQFEDYPRTKPRELRHWAAKIKLLSTTASPSKINSCDWSLSACLDSRLLDWLWRQARKGEYPS